MTVSERDERAACSALRADFVCVCAGSLTRYSHTAKNDFTDTTGAENVSCRG